MPGGANRGALSYKLSNGPTKGDQSVHTMPASSKFFLASDSVRVSTATTLETECLLFLALPTVLIRAGGIIIVVT